MAEYHNLLVLGNKLLGQTLSPSEPRAGPYIDRSRGYSLSCAPTASNSPVYIFPQNLDGSTVFRREAGCDHRQQPVSAQAPNHRGKRKGSEVRRTTWRAKNEKTGIVGNQVQAGELELLRPADPSVTSSALEGS